MSAVAATSSYGQPASSPRAAELAVRTVALQHPSGSVTLWIPGLVLQYDQQKLGYSFMRKVEDIALLMGWVVFPPTDAWSMSSFLLFISIWPLVSVSHFVVFGTCSLGHF